MKRVAVFGNAGRAAVPHDEYVKTHAEILRRDAWIIDGFGGVASAWERLAAADTLIHVDLPLFTHYRWVTKRLVKGLFVTPEGWPENSPMWSSTLESYRVTWRCHRRLTPRYRQLVADVAASKRVHHLRSPAQVRSFLIAVQKDHRGVGERP